MTESTPSPLGNVITIDDERIKDHLDRVVRGSVEETLNALWMPRLTAYATPSAMSAAKPAGIPGWPLRTSAAHQGWRSSAEGTQAPAADL
jgi:hypothetical protein